MEVKVEEKIKFKKCQEVEGIEEGKKEGRAFGMNSTRPVWMFY